MMMILRESKRRAGGLSIPERVQEDEGPAGKQRWDGPSRRHRRNRHRFRSLAGASVPSSDPSDPQPSPEILKVLA